MSEIDAQYRKTAIIVLAKALDDICPTFSLETKEERKLKVKERIEFFKESEVEIDNEWEVLEEEASRELSDFYKDREVIFSKILLTDNSDRVTKKVATFEEKKKQRVLYLNRKLERESASIQEKLKTIKNPSRKHAQLTQKIETITAEFEDKIRSSEQRFNTIIKNTLNSNNSDKVQERLSQSKKVWERKYEELKTKHETKEEIHHNKRREFDQIRVALEGFVDEIPDIVRWCTLAQVGLRDCYTEAIRRAIMVKRDYSGLVEVLDKIISGEIENG